jgi:hypothetical protein
MKNNLNIAFCFYGQTRVEDVINLWYKKIEKDYDFFMSTWDDENSRNLDFEFIKCNKHNFDIEKGKLQSLTPNKALDKNTKKLKIIKGNAKVLYVTFHICDVISSVKKYEKENNLKYDVIVFCRPDHFVDLNILKVEIDKFLVQSDIDVPIISSQGPIVIRKYDTFNILIDALYILNNKALDCVLNVQKDLFEERKDLEINYPYRGPHELFPFIIIYNKCVSIVNSIKSQIIRTPEYLEEYLNNEK